MLRGDSGEFQWAMASLNIPHATGYPLFTLLGYAWLHVPIAAPAAWRLNLLAAFFGAAAVAMVFLLSHMITRRVDAALASAAFLALAPVFWFNASILEVYTLNAFLLALILYLLVRWSHNTTSSWPLYLAFLTLGFALAHHRLIVLALPCILIFLVLCERRFMLSWRRLILCAILLLPGIALYTFVPLRLLASGSTLHFALYDIILGQEFSASFFREYHPEILWQIPFRNFHIGLILVALGAISFFRQARNIAVLFILIYITDAAFCLAYWVPDVQVFMTPSFVIFSVWIGAGARWVIDAVASFIRTPRASWAPGFASIFLMLLPFLGVYQYPNIVAEVSAEAGNSEPRARALLTSSLPEGSLLELDWETATAVRFIQSTESARQDIEARLIKVGDPQELDWLLKNVDSGRPSFVEQSIKWTRAVAGYRILGAPVGLSQIVRDSPIVRPEAEKIDDSVSLVGLQIVPGTLGLYWKVNGRIERDLATFVHFFDARGDPLGQEDHAPCCEAVYGYRTSEWEAGRQVADTFRGAPPGAEYIQVGMYALNGGDIDTYGRTIFLQIFPIEPPSSVRPLGIGLGDWVVARGYDLSNEVNSLRFTVYWQAQSTVDRDYTVFVHLLDASGKTIEQIDRQPLKSAFPTSAWKAGEVVADTFDLPAASNQMELEFGLYDAATGTRLARSDGAGNSIVIKVK